MRFLLAVSGAIDRFNEKIGAVCNLFVLLSCLVSAGNAMIRYAFSYSSNGWLELQWYFFAALVMFGASYTLKKNEHVRVEIFYLILSERQQMWLDLIGTLFFLIPVCLFLAYLSWPFFYQSYSIGEYSGNTDGLVRCFCRSPFADADDQVVLTYDHDVPAFEGDLPVIAFAR